MRLSIRTIVLSIFMIVSAASSLLMSVSLVQAAEGLSRAQAEASIARMSDAQVRQMLLEQLALGAQHASPEAEEFNPAVVMYRLQRDAGRLSTELNGIFAAANELPGVLPLAWARFSADREQGGIAGFVAAVVIAMLAGALVALFARSRVKRVFAPRLALATQGSGAKAKALAWQFLSHCIYIVIFASIASAVFIVGFDNEAKGRIAFFFYLAAAVIFLLSIGLSHAFHSPTRSALRLPGYSDTEARHMHRTVLASTAFGAFAYFTCAVIGTLGILGEVHELLLILVALTTTALLVFSIVTARAAITRDIRSGVAENKMRAVFARLWPWCFAAIVTFIMVAIIVRELLYDFVPYGAALFSIAIMAVLPALDALLLRESTHLLDADEVLSAALVRGARIALLVVATLALIIAWQLNPFAGENAGIGATAAAIALQLSLVLLVTYACWQLIRIVIDKKIAQEDAELAAQGIDASDNEVGGTGLSRTRTLLPLAKRSLQIAIVIISTMLVFSALGVDIAPLLAGAGVLGLAIGFGSQALVRDIVSGAFFLLDDAFRIGEYIDVGSVKGSVEKMSVRSVRLRHHRGAVHTVPFGEIKTLTNYSRDWAIMKLKFRVPFDTNVDKVRKLLKATGLKLAENEDIKDDFIQPFKSQGATEADDYGFVITTKFMSKPGKQFVIRRYAFAAVQKAFEENGIEFATPKVEVSVEGEQGEQAPRQAGIAGAGATQLRQQAADDAPVTA